MKFQLAFFLLAALLAACRQTPATNDPDAEKTAAAAGASSEQPEGLESASDVGAAVVAADAAAQAAQAAADAAITAQLAADDGSTYQYVMPAPVFYGYGCTDDCSGHDAGYAWAEKNEITDPYDCDGKSTSFVEGCEAYAEEQQEEQRRQEEEAAEEERRREEEEATYAEESYDS